MTSQTQIDYAIRYGKRLRQFIGEIELPRFKRVKVGAAYKKEVDAALDWALSNLKQLKNHLEEQ